MDSATIRQHFNPTFSAFADTGYSDYRDGSPVALAALRTWPTHRLIAEEWEMRRQLMNKYRLFWFGARCKLENVQRVLAERAAIGALTPLQLKTALEDDEINDAPRLDALGRPARARDELRALVHATIRQGIDSDIDDARASHPPLNVTCHAEIEVAFAGAA